MGKTYAPDPLDCTLGRGIVLINRMEIVAGVLTPTAYRRIGNVSDMKVTPNDELAIDNSTAPTYPQINVIGAR